MQDFLNSLSKDSFLNLTHICYDQIQNKISTRQNVQQLVVHLKELQNISKKVQAISEEMLKLNNLKYLLINFRQNMGLNNLKLITDQLKFLQNLVGLSLQIQQQQQGSLIYFTLSESLKEMENLQYLDLQVGNQSRLNVEGAQQIGIALSSLINLKSLKLVINSFNDLQTLGCQYLSQGIKNLSQLQELNLIIQNNNIYTEGAIFLSEAIKSLHNLQSLILLIGVQNTIGAKGLQALSEGYKDLIHLKQLNISIRCENFVGSEGVYHIGVNLKNLTKIEILYLQFDSMNEIEVNGLIGLGLGIQHLKNLTHLQLLIEENNLFNKEGISQLKEALSSLEKISHLELSFQNNLLEKEGLSEISQLISRKKNAKNLILKIQNNKIDSVFLRELGRSFKELIYLESLKLNLIEDVALKEGFASIFQQFEYLGNLKNLDLCFQFKSISCDYQEIASYLAKLKNIQTLSFCISKIGLDTENIFHICIGLSQLKTLKSLCLNFTINEIDQKDEIKNLTKALNLLTNVENLSLDFQHSVLQEIGLNQIAEGLANLNQLKQLSFEQLKPQYFGIETVAHFLEQIRLQQNLNLITININERSLHIKQQETQDYKKVLKMKKLVKYIYF